MRRKPRRNHRYSERLHEGQDRRRDQRRPEPPPPEPDADEPKTDTEERA